MTPTNEQIIAEAKRRWAELMMTSRSSKSVDDFIIEVMREGWTPPKPVDPDILAFREWAVTRGWAEEDATWLHSGALDDIEEADAYVAGARMAREQNQKRIEELVEGLKSIAILGQNHLLASSMAALTLSKSGEPGWVATRDELR